MLIIDDCLNNELLLLLLLLRTTVLLNGKSKYVAYNNRKQIVAMEKCNSNRFTCNSNRLLCLQDVIAGLDINTGPVPFLGLPAQFGPQVFIFY